MKYVSVLWLFTLLTFQAQVFGQDATTVRFYVKGSSEFWLRVDGETLPLSNVQRLSPGTHKLEVWSPMHKLHVGEINVPAADSINFYQELKKDGDYVEYLFNVDQYKRKILLGRTAPLVIALTGAVASPFLHLARKKWHEEMVISDFKAQYISGNNAGQANNAGRYNVANVLYFTGFGLAAGGIITHFALRGWVKNLEKPIYRQQNPFTLQTFEISYHPVLSAPQVGLTLSF